MGGRGRRGVRLGARPVEGPRNAGGAGPRGAGPGAGCRLARGWARPTGGQSGLRGDEADNEEVGGAGWFWGAGL